MRAVWYDRPGPAAEVLQLGALSIAIGDPLPLERAAQAHGRVDAGSRHRVLLAIPD